jgi:LuxR family maltose regulon positive regulatory protein
VVLVLDDYHVIESRGVQEGIAFLLDHMPPRLHLIIASRADPPLPLARLRARGELVEIRAADLRFTRDEASAYLTGLMDLPLTAQDVVSLEGRTEGWIAALQLAALSMQGRDDVAGFIAGFAGDDRYIVDYLIEEVLQNQPEQVHSFLLRTSILGRLNGPLCDAVTGGADGQRTLEALDRANLFLVPLDDRRRWYRYHHLFGEVLQARLLDEQPDEVPELHRRASVWHAQHHDLDSAIPHALAARDDALAADLVERAAPAMRRDRREVALRGWLERLPAEVFASRPVLSMDYVGALLASGKLDGVEDRLRDAERWLDERERGKAGPDGAAGPTVVDQDEFRRLPASVAIYRSGQALALGDAAATVRFARRALDLLDERDDVRRGAASALLGLASWGSGDLEAAYEAYVASSASLGQAGYLSDVLGCAITLADIRIVQGRLGDALDVYERALQLSAEQAGPVLRGTADMHVGIASILLERGDLGAAAEHLERGLQLGERTGMPRFPYRWRAAMAELRQAQGDLPAALQLLDDAHRVYVADFAPDVRPVAASRARVLIALGRVDDAFVWARAQHLSAADDLSYLHEFEHVTVAAALVARYRLQRDEQDLSDAVGLLDRLLAAAESGGRAGTVLEVLVLRSLADELLGDRPAAVRSLERALTLARPEGHVRVFVNAGPPMAVLLDAAARRGVVQEYARRLLAVLKTNEPAAPGSEPRLGLIEPLSEREREVLHLLETELSGPEIARRLFVSLNTVRTHTKSIYAKLGVTNRRAAVLRAEELARSNRATDPRS